ncbi:hypothetical protein LPA06_17890 [Lacticaseibacillus paracasei subsp. tolerans]|nr:hypothetical protein LPA04_17010 [Lacticaseibacillus paracasei subsp. paracasei]GEL38938.1 hypothetical protein LPA06_17890 [Lacticaseibacillus paracasei subsp. tolerans]
MFARRLSSRGKLKKQFKFLKIIAVFADESRHVSRQGRKRQIIVRITKVWP